MRGRLTFLLVLLLCCCVVVPDVEAKTRRRRKPSTTQASRTAKPKADAGMTAKPKAKAEPPARGITRYDARLFGPEVPLATIVKRLGVETSGGKIPGARLLVLKRERRLELFAGDVFLKAYRVQLGPQPVGPKVKVKDGRTPEGDYFLCARRPSKYHRGLWISYPNLEDAGRGVESGLISAAQKDEIAAALAAGQCPPQLTKLGGHLMLHGQDPTLTNWLARAQRKGQLKIERGRELGDGNPANLEEVWDWTQGCVALLNPDIRELYDALPERTPVSIRASGEPTRPGPWPPKAVPAVPVAAAPDGGVPAAASPGAAEPSSPEDRTAGTN